jgi:hypothetical protein
VADIPDLEVADRLDPEVVEGVAGAGWKTCGSPEVYSGKKIL